MDPRVNTAKNKLFRDTASNLENMASNDWMTVCSGLEKDEKDSSRGLI
jgi:hypothetical protein